MSDSSSAEDRRAAFDAVNRLLADGRLTLDEVMAELDEEGMQVLQRSLDEAASYAESIFDTLVLLARRAEQRERHEVDRPGRSREEPAIITAPQGTVGHEILSIRALLIGFDPVGALEVFDWIEESHDTRVEIGRAHNVQAAAEDLGGGDYDIAILDLSRDNGLGTEELATSAITDARIPVLLFVDRKDEARLLHLSWREYLVKQQITSQLLVRMLRFSVERHALELELERTKARERFHATRDHMTELPNRHHFRDELERALDRSSRDGAQLAVLFLDLDRFKRINDTFGHQVGDMLITTMASRLRNVVRKTDIVARVGGDEFIVMLRGADLEFAPAIVATKILDAVAQPFLIGEEEHSVSASIGISICPRDGNEPDVLIRNADTAMYQAKATGRNSYQFYSQSMNSVARRRLMVESRLRRAFECEELEVYFQPRIETGSWKITGAEALLRWTDSELGSVSPAEFIPIAEDSGLLLPIGDWVLNRACAEYVRWNEAGYGETRFSVNLSSHQIGKSSLRDDIVRALGEHNIDPSALEVEVTEMSLIENQESVALTLRELTKLGIGVSLDDFGTGFSSLAYLKSFPIDSVKIDQSFVRDMLVDSDDASITEAIISIAEKFQLRVVAEGVELIEQRDFLSARGCHEMQGFLFSHAVPGDEFLKLLAAGPILR